DGREFVADRPGIDIGLWVQFDAGDHSDEAVKRLLGAHRHARAAAKEVDLDEMCGADEEFSALLEVALAATATFVRWGEQLDDGYELKIGKLENFDPGVTCLLVVLGFDQYGDGIERGGCVRAARGRASARVSRIAQDGDVGKARARARARRRVNQA